MKPSPNRLRRLVRRARAHASDLRDPGELLHARLEAQALRRDYPGLAADLSSRSRPGARRYLIVSLNDRPRQVRLEALLAKSLQLRGAHVDVLAFRSMRGAVRAWRALGFRRLVYYEDFVAPGGTAPEEVAAAMAHCRTVQDFKAYEYRGARVGRQALATIVRARYEPRVDLDDPEVRDAIARTLEYGIEGVRTGERLLEELRPDALLMIERGYAGLGSFFDVALERGIDVIQFGSAHRDDAFLMKRYDLENRDLHPRSLDERTWARLVEGGWTEERERALEAELAGREEGKWFMARHARHSARRRGAERLRRDLGLDGRKVAVLFSHVLWDAAMFYGRDIYVDQGRWFEETLRLAAENDRVQWLVKLHPALFWKLEQEGVRAEPAEFAMIREAVGELPPHVRLIRPDDDVDNVDLFQIVDAGLTIRGTVGLELPRLGVPVLTAGTSDYAGRGFTVDAADPDEYERNVRGIADLERLDDEQVRLAKLNAYGVFCVRPWRFSSFTLDYLPPEEAGESLDHQLRFHVRTVEDLERAEDLRAFAEWVDGSNERDFVDDRALAAREPVTSE